MLCEKCKQQEACVAFSEVKSKQKVQHHLCEKCAKEQGQYIEEPSFSYSLQTLIGQFLEAIASKTDQEESKVQCDQCGLKYSQFRKQGRFNCENDYEAFREMLIQLFQQIHGASEHRGKKPLIPSPRSGTKPRKTSTSKAAPKSENIAGKIENLQSLLDEAVLEERYEEAARIRDEIKSLEGKKNGPL